MRIIKVATNEVVFSSLEKEAGILDFFKKKEEPKKITKEDKLVNHFTNHILPKVQKEIKRIGDIDNFNPNSTDVRFLIPSLSLALKEMYNEYLKTRHWSENPEEQKEVERILIQNPEITFDNYEKELVSYLKAVLNAKNGGDKIQFKIAKNAYYELINSVYKKFYEFSENYFRAIGRTDVIIKETK